jgi:AcrR family transcriptional regulator
MTRRALYHHFFDKEHLFTEVFRTVAEELITRSNAAVAPRSGELWSQFTAAYIHICNSSRQTRSIISTSC